MNVGLLVALMVSLHGELQIHGVDPRCALECHTAFERHAMKRRHATDSTRDRTVTASARQHEAELLVQ